MNQDRIHAREASHHRNRWSVGTIESLDERDGHCVVTIRAESRDTVELVVTMAIRGLFVGRLALDDGDSPVGERVPVRPLREFGLVLKAPVVVPPR